MAIGHFLRLQPLTTKRFHSVIVTRATRQEQSGD